MKKQTPIYTHLKYNEEYKESKRNETKLEIKKSQVQIIVSCFISISFLIFKNIWRYF